MSATSKFLSVHDAAQYVNDELHRRSLLPASRKLQFQTIDESALKPHLTRINNDKLTINTIHKLLKRIDELESLTVPVESPEDSFSTLKIPTGNQAKPAPEKRISKLLSQQRHQQVCARRTEVMLEQLRARLKQDGPDLTWSTRPIPEVKDGMPLDENSDVVTQQLRSLAGHKATSSAALEQLAGFLHDCNGYLYTKCVHHHECQIPDKIELTSVVEASVDLELQTSIGKLQELMNDWYDIAELLGGGDTER
ncbi:LAFA_0E06832g1_1 [Lachancea sp. 'fantastica']|nr:LAFA_0E06832g1_1 [Lachancea sp. 'fantastica']